MPEIVPGSELQNFTPRVTPCDAVLPKLPIGLFGTASPKILIDSAEATPPPTSVTSDMPNNVEIIRRSILNPPLIRGTHRFRDDLQSPGLLRMKPSRLALGQRPARQWRDVSRGAAEGIEPRSRRRPTKPAVVKGRNRCMRRRYLKLTMPTDVKLPPGFRRTLFACAGIKTVGFS